MPCFSTRRCAWVPFPAPGGPSSTSLMSAPHIKHSGPSDLVVKVQDGTNDNEKRRAAKIERYAHIGYQDFRNQTHQRKVSGTDRCDAGEDRIVNAREGDQRPSRKTRR